MNLDLNKSKAKNTFVMVAGEHSGDTLGHGLMQAIRRQLPDAKFAGVGGPKMQAVGFESWYPMETLAVMGIVDVLKRLPQLLRMRAALVRRIKVLQPSAFIGIDAPDFNLGLSLRLKSTTIKRIHYVSPSVWAWRTGRVKQMQQAVDRVLTLFPFEADFYYRHQVDAKFVGHPLADKISLEDQRLIARKALGLDPSSLVLGVLPGSRSAEIKYLGPCFIQTLILLQQRFAKIKFLAPMVNQERAKQFQQLIECNPAAQALDIDIKVGATQDIMAASDTLLMASGTATLEGLLHKKPMIIAYKWHPITHWLIAPLVKAPFIGLPNVLANKALVPEFVQAQAEPQALADAVATWLPDASVASQGKIKDLVSSFTQIHESLKANADESAAQAVLNLIKPKRAAEDVANHKHHQN